MDGKIIRTSSSKFAVVYRLSDLSVILASFILVTAFVPERMQNGLLHICIISICFLLIAESSYLYRSWRASRFQRQLHAIVLSWVTACFIGSVTLFSLGFQQQLFNEALLYWYLLAGSLLVFWRYATRLIIRFIRSQGYNVRHAAIIGTTANGIELANTLLANPSYGITPCGFYEDREDKRVDDKNLPLPILGRVEEALELAQQGKLQHIYIAMPLEAKQRITAYLNQFSDTTATVYLIPDFFIFNLLHSRWQTIGYVQTLSVFDTPFNGLSSVAKRIEDVVLSSLILLLIAPLMLVIAAAIKLTSTGPVIFKQQRYGLDGRKILVWKFRSMAVHDAGDTVKQATKNDPRVTPLGAFLRRTSLDELPQFINVLQGKMSVVGPRPHAVAHNEEYRQIIDRYMLRHKVKPGITGWAQINGYRGETETVDKMEKRVQLDLQYIENWSLWMDIKIVVSTVFKGFVGKTAY